MILIEGEGFKYYSYDEYLNIIYSNLDFKNKSSVFDTDDLVQDIFIEIFKLENSVDKKIVNIKNLKGYIYSSVLKIIKRLQYKYYKIYLKDEIIDRSIDNIDMCYTLHDNYDSENDILDNFMVDKLKTDMEITDNQFNILLGNKDKKYKNQKNILKKRVQKTLLKKGIKYDKI